MYFIFTYTNKHIYLQKLIVIFSSRTFLQTVWLPAGKSSFFFSFEERKKYAISFPSHSTAVGICFQGSD